MGDFEAISPAVRNRRDILSKYHQRLKEEAPFAYKPITPVVQTVEDAGVARRVARQIGLDLRPAPHALRRAEGIA